MVNSPKNWKRKGKTLGNKKENIKRKKKEKREKWREGQRL